MPWKVKDCVMYLTIKRKLSCTYYALYPAIFPLRLVASRNPVDFIDSTIWGDMFRKKSHSYSPFTCNDSRESSLLNLFTHVLHQPLLSQLCVILFNECNFLNYVRVSIHMWSPILPLFKSHFTSV